MIKYLFILIFITGCSNDGGKNSSEHLNTVKIYKNGSFGDVSILDKNCDLGCLSVVANLKNGQYLVEVEPYPGYKVKKWTIPECQDSQSCLINLVSNMDVEIEFEALQVGIENLEIQTGSYLDIPSLTGNASETVMFETFLSKKLKLYFLLKNSTNLKIFSDINCQTKIQDVEPVNDIAISLLEFDQLTISDVQNIRYKASNFYNGEESGCQALPDLNLNNLYTIKTNPVTGFSSTGKVEIFFKSQGDLFALFVSNVSKERVLTKYNESLTSFENYTFEGESLLIKDSIVQLNDSLVFIAKKISESNYDVFELKNGSLYKKGFVIGSSSNEQIVSVNNEFVFLSYKINSIGNTDFGKYIVKGFSFISWSQHFNWVTDAPLSRFDQLELSYCGSNSYCGYIPKEVNGEDNGFLKLNLNLTNNQLSYAQEVVPSVYSSGDKYFNKLSFSGVQVFLSRVSSIVEETSVYLGGVLSNDLSILTEIKSTNDLIDQDTTIFYNFDSHSIFCNTLNFNSCAVKKFNNLTNLFEDSLDLESKDNSDFGVLKFENSLNIQGGIKEINLITGEISKVSIPRKHKIQNSAWYFDSKNKNKDNTDVRYRGEIFVTQGIDSYPYTMAQLPLNSYTGAGAPITLSKIKSSKTIQNIARFQCATLPGRSESDSITMVEYNGKIIINTVNCLSPKGYSIYTVEESSL